MQNPSTDAPVPAICSRSEWVKPIGVYVHFPWCLRKCPYCDFATFERPREAIDHRGYANAVIAELDARRDWYKGRLETVFFGGGTPSLWEPAELGRVLEAILERAEGLSPDGVEVTVECNPSSLDGPRAKEFAAVGVNRLSVGVQGLDQSRLEFLGRLHNPDEALAAVRAAIASGVRVNADLMIGIATGFDERVHQAPAEAVREAAVVAALGVSHISAYQLTVEAKTRFGELDRNGIAQSQRFLIHRNSDVPLGAHIAHVVRLDPICGLEEENTFRRDPRVLEHRPLLTDHNIKTGVQEVRRDKEP